MQERSFAVARYRPTIDPAVQSAVDKLRKSGLTQQLIAARLGLSKRTVQKYLYAIQGRGSARETP
jgi:DNA-binding NarL/FixJ family response regulator